MEQKRFMVIDNQKGVVIPLQEEEKAALDKLCCLEAGEVKNAELEEKTEKIYGLMKALVKQSIKDTIREYNIQLTGELKEYEEAELQRWQRLEENDRKRWENFQKQDCKRWDKLEEDMEKHFKGIDQNIREKQNEGKRKKHSFF